MKQRMQIDADLDPQSLSRLEQLAAERGVPMACLIGEALERFLAYEAWFAEKVKQGVPSATDPPQEDVIDAVRHHFGWS